MLAEGKRDGCQAGGGSRNAGEGSPVRDPALCKIGSVSSLREWL